MHENFGVFRREEQMRKQEGIVDGLRERYERVVVEDKGDIFNNDLTQALELGFLLDLASCMVVAGIERKESRGAHARPYDFPDRDDENYMRHTLVTIENGAPRLGWKPVTVTKWQPMERNVLMRCLVLRERSRSSRPGCGGGGSASAERHPARRREDRRRPAASRPTSPSTARA